MASEILQEAIGRLQAMVDDGPGGTWDLSPNDKEAIRQVLAEVERLRGGLAMFPSGRLLRACELIERADQRASATDGPVPPTVEMMSQSQLAECLKILWACKEAALAAGG